MQSGFVQTVRFSCLIMLNRRTAASWSSLSRMERLSTCVGSKAMQSSLTFQCTKEQQAGSEKCFSREQSTFPTAHNKHTPEMAEHFKVCSQCWVIMCAEWCLCHPFEQQEQPKHITFEIDPCHDCKMLNDLAKVSYQCKWSHQTQL